MDKLKKILKALIFPHASLSIILIPVSAAFLIYSMAALGTENLISIASYVLSAYTLSISCVKIPKIIAFFKRIKKENKYIRLWSSDVRLRVSISLYGGSVLNGAYAVFQLCLGIYHSSFWYCSLFGYYICLSLLRFYLSRHTRKHEAGKRLKDELTKFRICGYSFLFINVTLSVILFFMIYFNKTAHHNQITAIALAAYTFTAFTVATVNIVRYKKYKSPVYTASKAISLSAACVSMITLTSTLLTTFGEQENDVILRQTMLSLLGGAVSIFIITMAVYMIAKGSKELHRIKSGEMQ